MNEDDFLRDFWQPPDHVFVSRLKQELNSPPTLTVTPWFDPIGQMRRTLNLLVAVMSVAVVFSPVARNQLRGRLEAPFNLQPDNL
jgi:hypothetical protein